LLFVAELSLSRNAFQAHLASRRKIWNGPEILALAAEIPMGLAGELVAKATRTAERGRSRRTGFEAQGSKVITVSPRRRREGDRRSVQEMLFSGAVHETLPVPESPAG
jgi:hypothetical protein